MSDDLRRFPIQVTPKRAPHPTSVLWSIAEKAYSVYVARFGTGQSLERLAERGGFCAGEMDEFYPAWRTECDQLAAANQRAEAAEARLREVEALAAWRLKTLQDIGDALGDCVEWDINCPIPLTVKCVVDSMYRAQADRDRLKAALAKATEALQHPIGCEDCILSIRHYVARGVRYLDRATLCAVGFVKHQELDSSSDAAEGEHHDARVAELERVRDAQVALVAELGSPLTPYGLTLLEQREARISELETQIAELVNTTDMRLALADRRFGKLVAAVREFDAAFGIACTQSGISMDALRKAAGL